MDLPECADACRTRTASGVLCATIGTFTNDVMTCMLANCEPECIFDAAAP